MAMSGLDTFIHKHFNNQHYCRKCGKKYEGQNDKKRCAFCGKYFCNDHITASLHSPLCHQKAVEYHNKNFCHYCNERYNSWADAHMCSVCGYYFCSKHWVPESHGCHSNSRPPGGLREVHHSDGRIDVYGK